MKCICNKQTEYKTETVNVITDINFLMTRNNNEGFDRFRLQNNIEI